MRFLAFVGFILTVSGGMIWATILWNDTQEKGGWVAIATVLMLPVGLLLVHYSKD